MCHARNPPQDIPFSPVNRFTNLSFWLLTSAAE
jgi:hypothetical protein